MDRAVEAIHHQPPPVRPTHRQVMSPRQSRELLSKADQLADEALDADDRNQARELRPHLWVLRLLQRQLQPLWVSRVRRQAQMLAKELLSDQKQAPLGSVVAKVAGQAAVGEFAQRHRAAIGLC